MDKNKVPVLVGTGQLVHREKTLDQMDPLKMMKERRLYPIDKEDPGAGV